MARQIPLLAAVAALGFAAPAPAAPTGEPANVGSALLDIPWEVVPMPDGRILATERAGGVRTIAPNGTLVAGFAFSDGAEKYLGLALHPGYASNRFVYLYETYAENGTNQSRILRLIDDGTALTLDREILDGIDSDLNHDGGRIAFGPDGKLYVTTGDIHDPSRPRDITNLNGKILRLEDDGAPAAGNPFLANPDENAKRVFSYGHRHPQGLAWDAEGRLWQTEHGPSGEGHAPGTGEDRYGRDELNLIEPGGDYGWPDVSGGMTLEGTIAPVCHSGPRPAWAPAGLAYAADGVLYAPALNGRHLHFFEIDADTVSNHGRLYDDVFGRLRVAVADGASLLFAQDGQDRPIKRVGIDASALPAGTSDCRPATPQRAMIGGGTTPPGDPGTTGSTPTAPPALTPGSPILAAPQRAAAAAATEARLDRVLGRARTALARRGGLTRFLRAGRLGVRAGGVPRGRIVLRLKLRRGSRLTTVAQGAASPRSRSAFTLRLRVGPRGRAALRPASLARLVLHVSYQPASGARVVRTLALTVRR